MEIKVGGSNRKAGISKLSKCVQIWDLHLCSAYLILFFAVLVSLFCFLYFDILHFTPSGGLLLNLSAIKSFSHSPSLTTRLRPSIVSSNQSPSHHHLHSSDDQEIPFIPSPLINESSTNPPLATVSDSNPSLYPPHSANPIADSPKYTENIANSQPNAYESADLASASGPSRDSSSTTDPRSSNGDSSSATDPISPSVDPSTERSDGASANGSKKEEDTKNGEVEDSEEQAESLIYERPKRKEGECDLYEGMWVRDEAYPLYRSKACPFIDEGFRCQENGRPDDGYLKWRWQPSGCSMPRCRGFSSSFLLCSSLLRLVLQQCKFIGIQGYEFIYPKKECCDHTMKHSKGMLSPSW
ncbi:hypothetical protein GOP47_0030147 [Adiantum capillus-veneris]|nr:hypothetical protein GOP47_0030147 [Adiantum capillus-veneris]